jgi:hypothetical protein
MLDQLIRLVCVFVLYSHSDRKLRSRHSFDGIIDIEGTTFLDIDIVRIAYGGQLVLHTNPVVQDEVVMNTVTAITNIDQPFMSDMEIQTFRTTRNNIPNDPRSQSNCPHHHPSQP